MAAVGDEYNDGMDYEVLYICTRDNNNKITHTYILKK